MNVQEYISSGIVESYVLGLASEQERAEFEKNCAVYPEIKAAREEFELKVEQQAMENAIVAPVDLKQKITSSIFSEGKFISTPGPRVSPVRKMNWFKYAAAACFILLAGSIYWNLSLQQKNNRLNEQLNDSANKLAQVEKDLNILQDNPAVKMVSMGGTQVSPHSFTTVYWDTASRDVYLLVNNLPAPASGQQYQLWALLDGKPIDMGILEITEKPLQLYRMKNAQAAQAFAITLEKKGGSPTPTLEKMYVMGHL